MLKASGLSASSTHQATERAALLKARFMALWVRCVRSDTSANAGLVYNRLVELYGEPHRHYHTLEHIKHCLDEFDQARTLMPEPDSVELALWFHDAIYQAGALDNERHSADLFRHYSSSGQADAALQQRVDELIMVTTHRGCPNRIDEQFIVDIDLSSFGLPWKQFMQDGQCIRAEFPHLMDDLYYAQHLHFLQGLQARPFFFFTDCFRQRYESTARGNIQRLMAELLERGYQPI